MIGLKKNKQAIIWRILGRDGNTLPDIPELSMFINPANIDASYQQIINETRTLGGFVQEHWGEQLISLSASGRTGMFYDENGVTNENAKQSEAFKNFLRLINIYKNNGKQYGNTSKIISVGSIVMAYRESQYEGQFESFTFNELAEKPYTLDYSFTFKSTRKIGGMII